MRDVRQIKIIQQSLERQKAVVQTDLTRINQFLAQKRESLQRLITYLREYMDAKEVRLSHRVPALHQNRIQFTLKIEKIIHLEENEIKKIISAQQAKLQQLHMLEQKLQTMNHFLAKIQLENMQAANRQDQLRNDDLAALKLMRGEDE